MNISLSTILNIIGWLAAIFGGSIKIAGIPLSTIGAQLPKYQPELEEAWAVAKKVAAKIDGGFGTTLKLIAKSQYVEPGSDLEKTWANRGMQPADDNHDFPQVSD